MPRLLLLIVLLLPSLALAQGPQVVVTVKPLHSLVAGVMEGVGEPQLLLRGAESPHSFNLRPSDGRALSRADAVVWLGPGLESFLVRPLESLAAEARHLTVIELPALTVLPARRGGAWESEHDHAVDHHAGGPGYDAHVWLDPRNAQLIVTATAELLTQLDPANGARYGANAQALIERLQTLDHELQTQLAPVSDRPYLVFHDGYQYLEHRYELNAVGSVTISAERSPGARRISQLRQRIRSEGVVCLFREPQFEAALVDTLSRGSNVRTGVLDPVGAALEPGPQAYFRLMRDMAGELRRCLGDRAATQVSR